MTTLTPGNTNSLRWTFVDGWTIVRRNLAQLRHTPSEIIGTLMFPIIMIVIFGYIFGSAIPVPGGGNYREYLTPGLFTMIATSAVVATLQKVAADGDKGVMDRFRSMPMARLAIPFGQTGADLIVSVFAMIAMAVCGLAVGWRVHNGIPSMLAAFGLLLLFGYSLNWAGVYLGLRVRNESTADKLAPLYLPVSMLSNTFVPTGGMPAWMRTIADWNPVSALVAACRQLFGNPGVVQSTAWPLQHPILATLCWSALLLLIFVPLAGRRYGLTAR
ncbi:multidrug ABC transporter permease [Actinosynnema sp. ALI-1.44]|uniref:ABC transporter permease n=1 Tax=Actinosynnema sp. ALI-1.44 TaxID=1933779 RepID=UPI00097C22C5|nr:ABC transporter permease [Actinosynnema sp. ALI-1.44]ONI89642.1 multidrug ABC transporter permease [Actinosynnema sp. ALI-1.44]